MRGAIVFKVVTNGRPPPGQWWLWFACAPCQRPCTHLYHVLLVVAIDYATVAVAL